MANTDHGPPPLPRAQAVVLATAQVWEFQTEGDVEEGVHAELPADIAVPKKHPGPAGVSAIHPVATSW